MALKTFKPWGPPPRGTPQKATGLLRDSCLPTARDGAPGQHRCQQYEGGGADDVARPVVLDRELVVFVRGGKGSVAIAGDLTKAVASGNVSGAVTGLAKAKTEAAIKNKVEGAYDSVLEQSEEEVGGGGKASVKRGWPSAAF